jgi:hypothetical protein
MKIRGFGSKFSTRYKKTVSCGKMFAYRFIVTVSERTEAVTLISPYLVELR